MRVLIAEDDAVTGLVVRTYLQKLGCDVVLVTDGEAACRAVGEPAEGPAFDLVLMDGQMPVLDGWDATRRILASQPELRIVGLTAGVSPEEIARCRDAGMVDVVAKPVAYDVLSALVSRR
jgi:CheY-like chemotaxis protein